MPTALCTHRLESGNPCRQVALRDERLCRFHIRNHRHGEREQAHDQAMDRLRDQLESMDLLGVLETLHQKLGRIQNMLRAYPEARLTLIIAIDRLQAMNAELNHPKSMTQPQLQQNQLPAINPSQINDIVAKLMESMNYD